MLHHLLPIVAACVLRQASMSGEAVLTRRGLVKELLGTGVLAVAVPTPVLASGDAEGALSEAMGMIDGMRVEVQQRFAAGPSKTVMVTGASTSAGFNAAKRIAIDGARVIVTAETQAGADELAERLREITGAKTVFSMQLNLGDRQSVMSSPARLAKALGASKPIDCLLDNTGILPIPDPTSQNLFDTPATLFYCKTSGE
jgi:NADPH:quinone reductase-like Zn-dependent oxidoreductase